jgi:lipopolysaccharide/colanic/teichoic acid biosynthesis glycosyltransferase
VTTIRVQTRAPGSLWNLGAKRCFDAVTAATLIVLSLPILAIIATMVRLTSRGPVLFRQARVGRDGREFTMLKFRSMRVTGDETIHKQYVCKLLNGDVEAVDGLYKIDHDPRITRIGGLLRKTSLDELPQLWNVLRGDMALIGPRPAIVWEVEMFPDWANQRFAVRPGITGLWQVSGRNRLTMSQGLALDVDYVAQRCFVLDLKILLLTLPAVLGRGTR